MPEIPDKDAVAARIRTARQRAGLSRAQAARRLGMSQKTVQRLEQRGTDSRATIRRLARAYGVSPVMLGYSAAELMQFISDVLRKGLRI